MTRNWLDKHDFFASTGMHVENICFCRERHDKRLICKELGINHFIDDRIHIMQILRDCVGHLYLFGNKEPNRSARKWVILVENWDEAFKAITGNIYHKGV